MPLPVFYCPDESLFPWFFYSVVPTPFVPFRDPSGRNRCSRCVRLLWSVQVHAKGQRVFALSSMLGWLCSVHSVNDNLFFHLHVWLPSSDAWLLCPLNWSDKKFTPSLWRRDRDGLVWWMFPDVGAGQLVGIDFLRLSNVTLDLVRLATLEGKGKILDRSSSPEMFVMAVVLYV